MIINIEFKGCAINETNRNQLQFEICRAISKEPTQINILFATTGGEIHQAFLFYEFIKKISFPIQIYNIGEIRSAGTIMFLAFENRYFLDTTKFLFHSVRLKNGIEETYKTNETNKKLNQKMLDIFIQTIDLPNEYISKMEETTDDIIIEKDDILKFSIAKFSNEKFSKPISIDCK